MSAEPSFDEAWHQLVVTLAKVLRLDRFVEWLVEEGL